jgi:hypothetical protein
MNHAYLAAQKKIFSKNLYTHNLLAIAREDDKQKILLSNLPEDSRGGKKFFSNSETSKVGMYASHPPNDKREDNAKVPFVDCETDERSPWILFASKEILQENMTALLYDQYLEKNPQEFASSEKFEKFIHVETAGKKLLEEYNNTFENRFLNIEDINDLEKKAQRIEQPLKEIEKLKTDLLILMKPIEEIESLMLKAQQISEGTALENSFSFKGNTYTKKKLQEGYEILVEEREKLFNESFKEWDTSFCSLHLGLADKTSRKYELIDLYNQHAAITRVYKSLIKVKNTIYRELNNIQSKEDVTQLEVLAFSETINEKTFGLNKEIESLDNINFVPMPNIDSVKELKEAIVENGSFVKEKGPIFENGGFDKIINRIENAVVHCQRLDQKSIGVILLFHKELQN